MENNDIKIQSNRNDGWMRNKILSLFVFFLILKHGISYSLVEIDITRGNLDPLPISVSPFFADEISKKK